MLFCRDKGRFIYEEILETIMPTINEKHEEKGTNVSIYLDYELIEWIDEKVKQRLYASRSHAVQACLAAQQQHIESKRE